MQFTRHSELGGLSDLLCSLKTIVATSACSQASLPLAMLLECLYRVCRKKVPPEIQFLVRFLLRIELKGVLFS